MTCAQDGSKVNTVTVVYSLKGPISNFFPTFDYQLFSLHPWSLVNFPILPTFLNPWALAFTFAANTGHMPHFFLTCWAHSGHFLMFIQPWAIASLSCIHSYLWYFTLPSLALDEFVTNCELPLFQGNWPIHSAILSHGRTCFLTHDSTLFFYQRAFLAYK